MKKTRFIFDIILLAIAVQFAACKKSSTPNVGFSVSQVNLDPANNPGGSVTVNVSKGSNEIIDLWIQMEGPDTLQFGTFGNRFINDDSARIVGSISSSATIDTTGSPYIAHITLGYNTTSFTIALTALNDNFPKRQVQYKLKIIKASNADISSSSSQLTINVASTPMNPSFASTLILSDPTYGSSTYTLSSASVSINDTSHINLTLAYNQTSGVNPNGSLSFSFNNVSDSTGLHQYVSTDGNAKFTSNFQLSPSPSPVRGNFYIMPDMVRSVVYNNGVDSGAGDVQCLFTLF